MSSSCGLLRIRACFLLPWLRPPSRSVHLEPGSPQAPRRSPNPRVVLRLLVSGDPAHDHRVPLTGATYCVTKASLLFGAVVFVF